MRQGKCVRCRVRWTWNGAPLLRDAYCPNCHGKLYQTSHRLSWSAYEVRAETVRKPQEATA